MSDGGARGARCLSRPNLSKLLRGGAAAMVVSVDPSSLIVKISMTAAVAEWCEACTHRISSGGRAVTLTRRMKRGRRRRSTSFTDCLPASPPTFVVARAAAAWRRRLCPGRSLTIVHHPPPPREPGTLSWPLWNFSTTKFKPRGRPSCPPKPPPTTSVPRAWSTSSGTQRATSSTWCSATKTLQR